MKVLERGDRFQYQSVVDRYRYRPEYPEEVYRTLLSFVGPTSAVLDIGCGPGKLSYPLAAHVKTVDAVDLSVAMIDAAKADSRDDCNIRWFAGDVHDAPLAGGYDLIVAGASIHWMDWDRLFPRLAAVQNDRTMTVFIDGDRPIDQPWGHEELELMKAVQLEINEERPPWVDNAVFPAPVMEFLVDHPWFDRIDGLLVRHAVMQSIHDYIETFFSRQSFALDCMSRDVADGFRRDMSDLLTPYAKGGRLTFDVSVTMEWGRLGEPGEGTL